MRNKDHDVPVLGCCDRTGELAERAHKNGEIFYLTSNGVPLAAVVPIGMKATALPVGSIEAAYDAAFPGLPGGMTEGEAKRRLTAALNVTHMHLADLLDRTYREGAEQAVSESWKKFDQPETEPDNPAADALARHIADHPLSTIQAAFRILGWKITFDVTDERGQASGRWAVSDPEPYLPNFPKGEKSV
jgi:hypothetical protein